MKQEKSREEIILYGEKSPLSTGLKNAKSWHYAMKSYILRVSERSIIYRTPFYTGLFSYINEGDRG